MLHNISFLDQYKTNHYTDRVLQWGLMIDWLMRGFLLEYFYCALREQETVPKYSDISAMITFIQHLIQFYQLPDNVVKDSSLSVIMCTKQCTLQTLCEKFWFLLQSFGELHLRGSHYEESSLGVFFHLLPRVTQPVSPKVSFTAAPQWQTFSGKSDPPRSGP